MLIKSFVKKIHYCWFGSEEPESVRKTVAHWQELNPDFEIIKWDENNTDVSAYEFGRRALRDRKWAYVADVVRLQKMIEQGGFYVDADVEMTSPLNRLEAYGDKLVMGYMLDCALGTAILYSPPDHPYLKDILAKYDHIRRNFYPRNNSIFTEYFINEVPGFLLDGKPFENGECKIFQKEFFEQPTFIKSRGISIHHACGSWDKEEAFPSPSVREPRLCSMPSSGQSGSTGHTGCCTATNSTTATPPPVEHQRGIHVAKCYRKDGE